MFCDWCVRGTWVLAAGFFVVGTTGVQEGPPYSVVEDLGAGVYVVRDTADSVAAPVHGSIVLIVGSDDVVVVDSSRTASGARRALATLREITDKPVRSLINTHWHEDHVLGNEVFAAAFPGLAIIGHTATRAEMVHAAEDFGPQVERFEASLERTKGTLERGTTAAGAELSETNRERLLRSQAMFEYLLPQDRTATFVEPNVVFDRRMSLFQGEREIRILHLGRGNTAGDVVVLLPADGVVVAGDLVVAPLPYGSGSFPSEWVDTMTQLDQLEFTTLVPGHGPVLRDRVYLRKVTRLLEQLVAAAHGARAAGIEVAEVIDSPPVQLLIEEFVGSDAARRRSMVSYFVRPVLTRAYEEPFAR
jgi:cyclase